MVEISDILVKANTLANASVEQFATSLTNKAASAMRSVNMELTEGVAVLAAFADQGTKGLRAGERFNILLRDMQKAANDNADEFKRLKIEVYDANGKIKNMADIVEDLEGALSGLSDEEKTAAMSALGFTEQSAAAINQLMGTSEKIREYQKALEDAGGTTERVANEQLQDFWSQLGLIKDRLVNTAIELWEAFEPIATGDILPALDNLVGKLRDIVENFSEMDEFAKKAILTLAGIGIVMGPALVVFGKISLALSSIMGLSTALGPAISGLSLSFTPFLVGGAIIAGITALAYAFNKVNVSESELADQMKEDYDHAKDLADRYRELKEKVELTVEEEQDLKSVSRELAGLFPDLVKGIDDQTGAYEFLNKELDETLQKMSVEVSLAEARVSVKDLTKSISELDVEISRLESSDEGKGILGADFWDIKAIHQAREALKELGLEQYTNNLKDFSSTIEIENTSNERRLHALIRVLQYQHDDISSLMNNALHEAVKITESTMGYLRKLYLVRSALNN